MKDLEALIRKHALLNAYRHEGRAEVGAVIGKVMAERPDLRPDVKNIAEISRRIVQEVNRLTIEEQLSTLKTSYPEVLVEERRVEERRLSPLPNAVDGEVVTRFPPEPNGYPHIGHAKAAIIDETYARLYHGRFILRFDDTNPLRERLEYYEAIRSGLEWLGVKPDLVKNTSDDIEILYRYAEKLILSDYAYVCLCPVETIKRNRASGIVCDCRRHSSQENLSLWKKMFSTLKQNEAVLRFRGDMKHLNTVMRDPTLFRIIDADHPLKGRRYRVWPTYDFSAPIEDSLDGVTHAMRTKEYELRDQLYFAILKALDLRMPNLIEFSRLELKGSPVSKRRLKHLLDDGLVQSWDDPRLPTLAGLKRRGITPDAIREFVLSMGVSKVESEPTWDLLESFNRKILDPIARRYYFVPDPVRLSVSNAPHTSTRIRFHPDKDLGERTVETGDQFYISREDLLRFSQDQIFRLIELYNVKLKTIEDDVAKGSFEGRERMEGVPKIQWVTEDHIPFQILVPGPLFIDERFNEKSLTVVNGLAERAASQLKVDEIVQFVRVGFCRIDGGNRAILTHR